MRLEKRLFMPHLQNAVLVGYRLLGGTDRVRLRLRPAVHFRPHDAPVSTALAEPFVLKAMDGHYEICSSWVALPPLRLRSIGANPTFTVTGRKVEGLFYGVEHGRGYESVGDLWAPGFFAADLGAGDEASLVASTEAWEVVEALTADLRRHLAHEPVSAQPESWPYRAGKFVRRHRAGVAASAALTLVVAAGIGGIAWQGHRRGVEAHKAEEVKAFALSLFSGADPDQARGEELTARELVNAGSARIETTRPSAPESATATNRLTVSIR